MGFRSSDEFLGAKSSPLFRVSKRDSGFSDFPLAEPRCTIGMTRTLPRPIRLAGGGNREHLRMNDVVPVGKRVTLTDILWTAVPSREGRRERRREQGEREKRKHTEIPMRSVMPVMIRLTLPSSRLSVADKIRFKAIFPWGMVADSVSKAFQ